MILFADVWKQNYENTMLSNVTMETSFGVARELVLVFKQRYVRNVWSVFLVCSTYMQDGTPSPRTPHLILKPKGAERALAHSSTASHIAVADHFEFCARAIARIPRTEKEVDA